MHSFPLSNPQNTLHATRKIKSGELHESRYTHTQMTKRRRSYAYPLRSSWLWQSKFHLTAMDWLYRMRYLFASCEIYSRPCASVTSRSVWVSSSVTVGTLLDGHHLIAGTGDGKFQRGKPLKRALDFVRLATALGRKFRPVAENLDSLLYSVL